MATGMSGTAFSDQMPVRQATPPPKPKTYTMAEAAAMNGVDIYGRPLNTAMPSPQQQPTAPAPTVPVPAYAAQSAASDQAMRDIQVKQAEADYQDSIRPPQDMATLLASLKSAAFAPIATPSEADDEAASTAAFGKAKDTAGLLALRKMSDSRDNMTTRGVSGSGIANRQADAILQDPVNTLTDVATTQAENTLARKRAVADRNYQGALTQRQQDMSVAPSLLSLFKQSRGRVY